MSPQHHSNQQHRKIDPDIMHEIIESARAEVIAEVGREFDRIVSDRSNTSQFVDGAKQILDHLERWNVEEGVTVNTDMGCLQVPRASNYLEADEEAPPSFDFSSLSSGDLFNLIEHYETLPISSPEEAIQVLGILRSAYEVCVNRLRKNR